MIKEYQMKLSIVIVNYNVKHFLEQCLHSVRKAIHNIDAEVFVVDNNSVDGSIGMLVHKFPEVKLIANKRNVGFARANNQAIKQSKGEYVLLLNPDTVVEENSFEKIIAFMDATHDAGALGVKMIDGRGHFLPESKRGLPTPWVAFYKIFGLSSLFKNSRRFGRYHLSYLGNDEIHKVDVLAGAFMFMRREALDKTGLLDEDYFMYGEDIDLSYKITQSGYHNYYYPETTIIHYKGESTKKGSLNYVRMFYNAMIIFARKHFSKQYAGLFSFFIHLAIYIRAGIAAFHRLVKKLWLPMLDFVLMWAGFMLLLPYWEAYRFEPGYYPGSLINYIVPAYLLSWLVAMYYSGGYDRPVSLLKIGKGLGYGTIFILVVYSLLPNSLRFSRAIILLGAAMSTFIILFERVVLHFLGNEKYKLGTRKPKRVAIVGLKKESGRVYELLQKTGLPFTLAGYISTKRKPRSERYLGSVYQVREMIRINKIDELIFCSEDISSQMVIRIMLQLSDFKVDYKIAPPASVSIIGSNSIETAGDLYVVNVNAITREKNKRNKRLFDVVFALSLLLFSFIAVWFVDNKKGFFRNIFKVLGRKYSWVGYHPVNSELYLGLPVISKGILQTTDLLNVEAPETDVVDRLNVAYARDYKVLKDVEIVFKAFKKIGDQ